MKRNEDKNRKSKKNQSAKVAKLVEEMMAADHTSEDWQMGWKLWREVERAKKRGLIKVKMGENPLLAELRYVLDLLWESYPEWRWN